MRILVIRMLTWRWLDDVLALAAGTALTAAGYMVGPVIGTITLGACLAFASRRVSVFLASESARQLRIEMETAKRERSRAA